MSVSQQQMSAQQQVQEEMLKTLKQQVQLMQIQVEQSKTIQAMLETQKKQQEEQLKVQMDSYKVNVKQREDFTEIKAKLYEEVQKVHELRDATLASQEILKKIQKNMEAVRVSLTDSRGSVVELLISGNTKRAYVEERLDRIMADVGDNQRHSSQHFEVLVSS